VKSIESRKNSSVSTTSTASNNKVFNGCRGKRAAAHRRSRERSRQRSR
jgi:hypothetical protein